jgi:ATP-dependent RNA helicase DeaD
MMIVDELAAYYDPSEIAAAAIKLLMRERGTVEEAESITQKMIAEPGMTRLSLSVGRKEGVRPMDIVGAIANEARIPGKSIGEIEILDHTTCVEVPESMAEHVVRALNRTRVRGRPVRAEVASAAIRGDRRL